MSSVKKVWLTKNEHFTSLSLESKAPKEAHTRVMIHDSLYPENPTPEHPLRHVVVLSCLSDEDLYKIYEKIGEYLKVC